MSPLHIAAQCGNHKGVRILLACRMDVNHTDLLLLRTAVHEAALSGHEKAVLTVLKNGANVKARGESFDTASHYATRNGIVDALNLFMKYGADLKVRNGEWSTSLHDAAELGELQCVNLLIQQSLSVYERSCRGSSALGDLTDAIRPLAEGCSVIAFVLNGDFCLEAQDLLWGWTETRNQGLRLLLKRYPGRNLMRDVNTQHSLTAKIHYYATLRCRRCWQCWDPEAATGGWRSRQSRGKP